MELDYRIMTEDLTFLVLGFFIGYFLGQFFSKYESFKFRVKSKRLLKSDEKRTRGKVIKLIRKR